MCQIFSIDASRKQIVRRMEDGDLGWAVLKGASNGDHERAAGLNSIEPGTVVDAPKLRGMKGPRFIRGVVEGMVPVPRDSGAVFVRFPKGTIPFYEVVVYDADRLKVVANA
ncbi:MAG TPA: hypothetical protein VEB64_04850 [Azospirillaceae bacterium]|nr:hypothetical protein [Azospirillaceae bacterium]